jgi:hypothetical protein
MGLAEIIHKPKELQDPLMLKILEDILSRYDDLISDIKGISEAALPFQ